MTLILAGFHYLSFVLIYCYWNADHWWKGQLQIYPLLRSLLPSICDGSQILFLFYPDVYWTPSLRSISNGSEVKWSEVKVAQLCPTLCDPMYYTVHDILQVRILEWVVLPFSRGSSQPRNRTQVSHIAGIFFTSWATGKPNNTRVGTLSVLLQIFSTQELNQGLLHCRQILYQLSYQGSPSQMDGTY